MRFTSLAQYRPLLESSSIINHNPTRYKTHPMLKTFISIAILSNDSLEDSTDVFSHNLGNEFPYLAFFFRCLHVDLSQTQCSLSSEVSLRVKQTYLKRNNQQTKNRENQSLTKGEEDFHT